MPEQSNDYRVVVFGAGNPLMLFLPVENDLKQNLVNRKDKL